VNLVEGDFLGPVIIHSSRDPSSLVHVGCASSAFDAERTQIRPLDFCTDVAATYFTSGHNMVSPLTIAHCVAYFNRAFCSMQLPKTFFRMAILGKFYKLWSFLLERS